MSRKRALTLYLSGVFCQIWMVCIIVFLLRKLGMTMDYTTPYGLAAVAVGGISSALWGIIVAVKYKKYPLKKILKDYFNVLQKPRHYLLVLMFLLLDFLFVFFGAKANIGAWYRPVILLLMAVFMYGGIEEIGWRYIFQPVMQEKRGYIISTLATFAAWGTWHISFFYIDGTLNGIDTAGLVGFLAGLLTNCFILSTVYNKTKSLWLCVLCHSLINVFSQLFIEGGSSVVSWICRVMIIVTAVALSGKTAKDSTA